MIDAITEYRIAACERLLIQMARLGFPELNLEADAATLSISLDKIARILAEMELEDENA